MDIKSEYLNLGRAVVLQPSGSCSAGPDTLDSLFCEKMSKMYQLSLLLRTHHRLFRGKVLPQMLHIRTAPGI